MANSHSVLPRLFLPSLKCSETSLNQFHAPQTGSTSMILLVESMEFSFLTDPHMSTFSCLKLFLEPMIVISLAEMNAENFCISDLTIFQL